MAESLAALTHQIVDVHADNEAFRRTLVPEVTERHHSFELQVQLNTDLALHAGGQHLREVARRVVPLGDRRPCGPLPRQDIGGEDNVAAADATYNSHVGAPERSTGPSARSSGCGRRCTGARPSSWHRINGQTGGANRSAARNCYG